MDLLGDIVERDFSNQNEGIIINDNNTGLKKDNPNDNLLDFNIVENNDNSNDITPAQKLTGFPELYKPKKISSWKQRLREKKKNKTNTATPNTRPQSNLNKDINNIPPSKFQTKAATTSSQTNDIDSIHQENVTRLQNMSQEEIMNEQKELLESLSPKLIQNLLKNINNRSNDNNGKDPEKPPLFAEIEGASGTWIGGYNQNLPKLDSKQVEWALMGKDKDNADTDETSKKELGKHIRFDLEQDESEANKERFEDDDLDDDDLDDLDADDVAPLDYQMAQSIDHMTNDELLQDVHFMKKLTIHDHDENETPLDINDPDFDNKLHEKYFPDLPKDVDKLKWMEPVPDLPEDANQFIIDDVSLIRFDFNGNLVPPTRDVQDTVHSGLHHHSVDPQLAGYTLLELNRLAKSTFASQRCIAIQSIGRILYKLGKQTYYQLVPEIDSETYKEDGSIQNVMNKIYSMFWDLIKSENIILTLEVASNEQFTKNLSVRTYAIDALWLWKKGGGDFRDKKQGINN